MADRNARPAVRLQYLVWDGTDPVDSQTLATRLERTFRCVNLLDDSPSGEFGVRGTPRVFQPCGAAGTDLSDSLWVRGMVLFPVVFFHAVHNNTGGDLPNILQYSGHGIPGFMFSESMVEIATSRPIQVTAASAAVGVQWNFLDIRWNDEATKIVMFSACRQLSGKPQQFFWSERMRSADHRVHVILSYRETAPAASTSATINRSFVAGLAAGQTFINAWRNAHGGSLRRRWAALAFRSCVGDRMDLWVRSGSLASTPAVDEDILYFDESNRSGRVVTRPSPDFDMSMIFMAWPNATTKGTPPVLITGNTVPPWTALRTGTLVNLQINFLTDSFRDGDKVWLAALQVRPDYGGPFDIDDLFTFPNQAALLSSGDIATFGRLHDESARWIADTYTDLYEFTIRRAGMSFGTLNATFNQLTLPVIIGRRSNDHLPIFYFMVRVERGGSEFGVPTNLDARRGIRIANQARLIDEPQFCVFILAEPPPSP